MFERCEFARRRSQRTAQGTRMGMPRPTWFWVLLPKEKDLVCRDETRHFIEKEGWSKYGYGEDGEGKKIGLYLP